MRAPLVSHIKLQTHFLVPIFCVFPPITSAGFPSSDESPICLYTLDPISSLLRDCFPFPLFLIFPTSKVLDPHPVNHHVLAVLPSKCFLNLFDFLNSRHLIHATLTTYLNKSNVCSYPFTFVLCRVTRVMLLKSILSDV